MDCPFTYLLQGNKVWQLRFKLDGKEKILTVGKYPLMSLQEAHDKAYQVKKDISDDIDPVRSKKKSEKYNSFLAIYKEWYAHKRQVWSEGYVAELQRMFETNILPLIGAIVTM